MGEFVNPKWLTCLTGTISVILIVMNFYLLVPPGAEWWVYFIIAIVGVLYLSFIAYVLFTKIDQTAEPIAQRAKSEYDLENRGDKLGINYSAVTPPASFIDVEERKEPFISPN